MTIITIDNITLVEILTPILKIGLAIFTGIMIFIILKIFIESYTDNINRKQLKELKQIYTARKRQFEEDKEGWKRWRDANYKITDLMEADSYY